MGECWRRLDTWIIIVLVVAVVLLIKWWPGYTPVSITAFFDNLMIPV